MTPPFKTVHFQIFCKNYYDEVNGCFFYKLYTDEMPIENSNVQLDIKIIMLECVIFKIKIPIYADVNVTEKKENLICLCV